MPRVLRLVMSSAPATNTDSATVPAPVKGTAKNKNKSKGKSQSKAHPATHVASLEPRRRPCRLLALPGEIRDQIWDYVFSPQLHVKFRSRAPRQNKHYQALHQPRAMGEYTREAGRSTNWRRSYSSPLLACKQIHKEAKHLLYENTVFHFEDLHLTAAFLDTVSRPKLQFVKSIVVKAVAEDKKIEQEARPVWRRIRRALPNVENLKIQLGIHCSPANDGIAPAFDDPGKLFTEAQLDATPWLQQFKIFRGMTKLKSVRVEIWDWRENGDTYSIFWGCRYSEVVPQIPGVSFDVAEIRVAGKWSEFFKQLYRSFGDAMEKIILNQPEPWKGHCEMLQKYEDWRNGDVHQPTGLYGIPSKKCVRFNGEFVWI